MKKVSEHIPGYSYGTAEVAKSPVSMMEFYDLKISAGFTEEDQRYLRLAGEVLADQTRQIVEHWRSGIIAGIPNLARHSRTPEGNAIPLYLAKSNLRFSNGFWTPACGPTIRTGSTTSRKLHCGTPARRRTRSMGFARRRTYRCGT